MPTCIYNSSHDTTRGNIGQIWTTCCLLMWTQGHATYLCIRSHTKICYLVIAGVQPVTLPPPAPPPPPCLGIESDPPSHHPPSVNGKSRSALLSSIQTFSKGRLKKADTNDRSSPHIWATLLMVLSSYHVQFVLGRHIWGFQDLIFRRVQRCFHTGLWGKLFLIFHPRSEADQRWWG